MSDDTTGVGNDKVEYDEKTGAIRSFFGEDLFEESLETASDKAAGEKTTDFLERNKMRFQLENIDLVQTDKREGSVTESITYQQQHQGVPVYGARLVVGMRKEDSRVTSSVNQVDYELPTELRPEDARLSSQDAASVVRNILDGKFTKIESGKPQLFVYRFSSSQDDVEPPHPTPPIREELLSLGKGEDGQVYLAWQVLVDTFEPNGNWEFLIDAVTGEIVNVKDRRSYISRKGFVFMPDPITTSGNLGLSSLTNTATLNPERREVDIDNLNTPPNGQFRLEGKWAECQDIEPPFFGQPVTTTDFKYNAKDREFLSVMAYYWIDRLIEYLRGFGVPTFNQTVENVKIALDAQGLDGDDNSHFTLTASGKPYLAFGEGGVPDAADAHVIAHEYGHALHWYMNSRQNSRGNEEGFGDFLGGAWLDRFNTLQFQRRAVFPWDNNNNTDHYSDDRFFDTTRKYSDANFSGLPIHVKGSVLAAALWDLYQRMGGSSPDANTREQAADRVIHLYLEMLVSMPNNVAVRDLGNGLITADQAINGGANAAAISAVFAARGLNL